MKSSYGEALARVLRDEGGYADNPSDPGGPTNFGITLADYRKYIRSDATAADVKVMQLDDARAIYRSRYWDAQRCDELPAGVDYAVFDYGVNSGVGRSGKVLRRALKLSDATGAISDDVIAAAGRVKAADLIDLICMERLAFLKSLKTWPVFGKGWGRRVAGVRVAALAMTGVGVPPTAPAQTTDAVGGKAVVGLNTGARKASAGVIVASGVAASAHASTPMMACLVLGVAALALIAALLFWRRDQRRRQQAPAPLAVIPQTSGAFDHAMD